MKTRHDVMRAEFKIFDKNNPEVWEHFVDLAKQRICEGYRRYSSDAICHHIRWTKSFVGYDGLSGFKLCDHHTQFYARKFIAQFPEHRGFFLLKNLPSKTKIVSKD
jgi:hypothetical protein